MADEKKEEVRDTKKEHVDAEKNEKAWKEPVKDKAGVDWSKPKYFGQEGQV